MYPYSTQRKKRLNQIEDLLTAIQGNITAAKERLHDLELEKKILLDLETLESRLNRRTE